MNDNILEFRKQLKDKLKPNRYEHTISVSFLCTALAMRYNYDLEKAELAGLLHDCAKHFSDEELIKKCKKQNILLTEDEKKAKSGLHAIYGAWLVKHKYGIEDQDIRNAIRWHTTGKPNMALLEKIVFTADYIEPRRNEAKNLTFIRSLAFQDLDECIYHILIGTLNYLEEKDRFVDAASKQAYAYYKQIHNDKKGE
jgi:predicted HD superfamily hydrolase involved in NAD metabolism